MGSGRSIAQAHEKAQERSVSTIQQVTILAIGLYSLRLTDRSCLKAQGRGAMHRSTTHEADEVT